MSNHAYTVKLEIMLSIQASGEEANDEKAVLRHVADNLVVGAMAINERIALVCSPASAPFFVGLKETLHT